MRFDLEQPDAVGILVDALRSVGGGLVGCDDFTRDRRMDVRSGLDRLDHGAFGAGLELPADLRQFEEDDVAQGFLGVVGDAHRDQAVAVLAGPFVGLGVLEVCRDVHGNSP